MCTAPGKDRRSATSSRARAKHLLAVKQANLARSITDWGTAAASNRRRNHQPPPDDSHREANASCGAQIRQVPPITLRVGFRPLSGCLHCPPRTSISSIGPEYFHLAAYYTWLCKGLLSARGHRAGAACPRPELVTTVVAEVGVCKAMPLCHVCHGLSYACRPPAKCSDYGSRGTQPWTWETSTCHSPSR
ncbi:hypothetical protein SVAN01_10339 [Stagonosporopsis vannaccii]|nr:hypothetical protein SVAN01_10339 [Stagonosporopsis vannaccii]